MSIQIDNSLFLPQIKRFARSHRPTFKQQSMELGEEALGIAQQWFDDAPWESGPIEWYDTQRECRIELKRYIMDKIELNNSDKSYFVPSVVWIWLAKMVITYVVKLLIEHYWPELKIILDLEW